ncbi:hypothetical protein BACCOPRO_02786 [Phocaeicola coprophilus DSM 18228 = JCM 13818]|uniref:Uncharacterized protein n=1 Tax=Phocaeicola coprophilus DSM 18228 = JCM 13818 TaxID=547042 RepID=S0FBQ2_9BACT|nr:hypothetical protein BACCOPRO_02786 [Phocaeicola coprophilus DSM 18228 = JCM 13818]
MHNEPLFLHLYAKDCIKYRFYLRIAFRMRPDQIRACKSFLSE